MQKRYNGMHALCVREERREEEEEEKREEGTGERCVERRLDSVGAYFFEGSGCMVGWCVEDVGSGRGRPG